MTDDLTPSEDRAVRLALEVAQLKAKVSSAERKIADVQRYANLTLGSISVERVGMAEDVLEIINGFPTRAALETP